MSDEVNDIPERDRTHRKFIRSVIRSGVGSSFRFPPFAHRIRVLAIDAETVTVLTGDGAKRVFPREIAGRVV